MYDLLERNERKDRSIVLVISMVTLLFCIPFSIIPMAIYSFWLFFKMTKTGYAHIESYVKDTNKVYIYLLIAIIFIWGLEYQAMDKFNGGFEIPITTISIVLFALAYIYFIFRSYKLFRRI